MLWPCPACYEHPPLAACSKLSYRRHRRGNHETHRVECAADRKGSEGHPTNRSRAGCKSSKLGKSRSVGHEQCSLELGHHASSWPSKAVHTFWQSSRSCMHVYFCSTQTMPPRSRSRSRTRSPSRPVTIFRSPSPVSASPSTTVTFESDVPVVNEPAAGTAVASAPAEPAVSTPSSSEASDDEAATSSNPAPAASSWEALPTAPPLRRLIPRPPPGPPPGFRPHSPLSPWVGWRPQPLPPGPVAAVPKRRPRPSPPWRQL